MNINKNLEGNDAIQSHLFLAFSLTKTIFLGIPLCLTIIGLYFIIKSTTLRMYIFYTSTQNFNPQQTNYIYVVLKDETSLITQIFQKQYRMEKYYAFICHELKYQIKHNHIAPIGQLQLDQLRHVIENPDYIHQGLSDAQFRERMSYFGRNQHKVQIPSMLVYLFTILTGPLFIIQQLMYVVWWARGLIYVTVTIILYNLIVITINYVLLRRNYEQIKKMAEKQTLTTIVRQGSIIHISSNQIVPGDIFKIEDTIPCDCILVQGEKLIVNQANFSGQNLPILKYKIQSLQNIQNKAHWLYEGSQILQKKQNVWAMAIYTGFTSHRGKIIRKIIHSTVKQPLFTKNIILLFVQIFMITSLIYLALLPTMRKMEIDDKVIMFTYLVFITMAVPIGGVGNIHMVPGISLYRMKKKNIGGRQPYKVYTSAQIQTIFFDKTGTLTEKQIQLAKVYQLKDSEFSLVAHDSSKDTQLISLLFSTCHMLVKLDGCGYSGDEIDLKMFERSGAQILSSKQPGVFQQVQVNGSRFQILRVNQFQSRNMSMSVLVRSVKQDKFYIFVKGSPQLIHKHSVNSCTNFQQILKELSFEGYRMIALAYKPLPKSQLQTYLKADSQIYLQSITMLGIACFQNKLKPHSKEVIDRLTVQCGITSKMITGDNIYTAVHTALECGIIQQNQTVVVCEAKNVVDADKMSMKVIELSVQNQVYSQKTIFVECLKEYVEGSKEHMVFAIQASLISYSDIAVSPKIKIFARATPKHKIHTILHNQQHLQHQYTQRTLIQKLFYSFRPTICMVGDGANDLMAIQQADIGIAFLQTDATFSSDFVINELQQIQEIIRQGKSISQTIMQIVLINSMLSWQNLILFILMMYDLSSWRGIDNVMVNVFVQLIFPFLLALSNPSDKNTTHIPEMNILSFKHQLKYLSNNLLYFCTYLLIFALYWRSQYYQPLKTYRVVKNDGWLVNTHSNCIYFLLMTMFSVNIPLSFYDSHPWKQPCYKNTMFVVWCCIWVVINLLAFIPPHVLLKIQHLPSFTEVQILQLMVLSLVMNLLNNRMNQGINLLFDNTKKGQTAAIGNDS